MENKVVDDSEEKGNMKTQEFGFNCTILSLKLTIMFFTLRFLSVIPENLDALQS